MENVTLIEQSTIADATKQLKLTATTDNQTITYFNPAATAHINQQGNLSTQQDLIKNKLMNTCYSRQAENPTQEDRQITPVIIICDSVLPSQHRGNSLSTAQLPLGFDTRASKQ